MAAVSRVRKERERRGGDKWVRVEGEGGESHETGWPGGVVLTGRVKSRATMVTRLCKRRGGGGGR